MTTYAQALAEISSRKHLLFEVEPAEEVWGWTLTSGKTNTYETSWSYLEGGLYRLLISVEEDGTALRERASIGAVESNAGSWYYDSAAEKIYVHSTGSADPDTVDMMAAVFRLHFSTTGRSFGSTTDAGQLARDFDGTNDYYLRGSDLTGCADGLVGLISFWVRFDGGDGTLQRIFKNESGRFTVTKDASGAHTNQIHLQAFNSSAELRMDLYSATAYTASDGWLHVIASWDVDTIGHLYVNDADDGGGGGFQGENDVDYTRTDWCLGAQLNGNTPLNGAVSEFYFALEYLDISVQANRRKFIDANGNPVPLGSDGSLPTGNQPIIYAPDGDPTTNLGSGGNFVDQGAAEETDGPNPQEAQLHYDKRILTDSHSEANFIDKAADLIVGRQRTSQGELSLDNSDALFDKLSRTWNWKNKAARFRFGIDDIALSEYQTAGRLVVDDIAPTEERLTLTLVSEIDAWLRRFPVTPHFGSGLGEGVVGTRVPILIGSKSDIVPDLIDDEYTTPNEWIYRIADNTFQTLDAVSAVYAINRGTGARTTLTLTTHYTVNLTNCTITVNDAFDSGAEIEEEYEIRCDAAGQPAASTDTSTDYLKYPGEVAHWLLTTFLGYSDGDLDLTSFSDADSERPFALGFWIKKETTVREVLRGIERSTLGSIRVKNDGTVDFDLWDPGAGAGAAEEFTDEDFSSFVPDVKMETVYYETNVRYDENPANPGSFQVQTVSDNATRYLNHTDKSLTVDTYLTSSSDAELLAQRINDAYSNINVEIDFVERGVRLMSYELNQRVNVTKTRAPSTAGSYTSRMMNLIVLEKDFITPQVSGRFRVLVSSRVEGVATIAGVGAVSAAGTVS